jgi:hypothetical protein
MHIYPINSPHAYTAVTIAKYVSVALYYMKACKYFKWILMWFHSKDMAIPCSMMRLPAINWIGGHSSMMNDAQPSNTSVSY